MALRTAAQFLAGLRDAREVYYRGQRVPSVVDHPELGVAARHSSIDFAMAENPKYRELAVHREGSDEYSAFYRLPRHSQDLLSRSKLIEAGTAEGATLVLLIKEIGTDALFWAAAAMRKEFSVSKRFTAIAGTRTSRWLSPKPM